MANIDKHYQLIVIGGGINGAAIARDAADRGLSVLLLEKEDFASGASSKSSKLAHGGLRYLEQMEFHLVKESLEERNALFCNAPHLVRPQPFLYTLYRGIGKPRWLANIGLSIYDWFDRGSKLPRHCYLNKEETRARAPGLTPVTLEGCCHYYDGVMDDARLVIANILSARAKGAHLYNYTEVLELVDNGGRVCGVRFRSLRRGIEGTAKADLVINATGAWSDALEEGPPLVRPSKGIHLVLNRHLCDDVLVLTSPIDRRIIFLIPWEGMTLLGTTDIDFSGNPDNLTVEESEVSYLLKSANRYFLDTPITVDDIVSSFAGLRPLATAKRGGGSSADSSRDHRIDNRRPGLLSIVGGKYTTHRKIAEEVVNKAVALMEVDCGPCTTKKTALFGAEIPIPANPEIQGLDPEESRRLAERYGCAYSAVGNIIHADTSLKRRLCPHQPYLAAELVYAFTTEDAMTLNDWYYRRTAGAYRRCCSRRCTEDAAAIAAPLMNWSPVDTKREVDAYVGTLL